MRVLLDESLPRGLKDLLPGLDVTTAPERGWRGLKNGELLALASKEFDVFLTADQSLEYQQNLASLSIGIVVRVAPTNRLQAYVPLASEIRDAIQKAHSGSVTRVVA